MTLPLWLIDGLLFWLEPLKAEETQAAALAGALPWLKPNERRRITRAWQKAILRAAREERTAVITEDPAQARAWFARLGAKIE